LSGYFFKKSIAKKILFFSQVALLYFLILFCLSKGLIIQIDRKGQLKQNME